MIGATLASICAMASAGQGQSFDSTQVHLYRPGNTLGSALKAWVVIDDSLEIRLKNNEHKILVLAQGSHTLKGRKKKDGRIEIPGEPGSIYYVRVFF